MDTASSTEIQPAVTPPQPVVTPAQPAVTPLELLYGKLTLNTSLLVTIDNLKRKGFNNSDIPCLILSVLEVYNSYTSSTRAHTLTVDDVQTLLERVYNYLVDKYDLVAPSERLAMYSLFNASLKLCLAVPNVKKEVTSCLKFFRC